MKKTHRFLCMGLALCLMLGLIPPTPVLAAADITVYLDPANGNDSTNGLTESTAVKSFETAYSKIKTAGGGTIVFLSTLTYTSEKRLPDSSSSVPVTLTSKTGAEGITSSSNIRFMCPATLENITMTLTTASSYYSICGEGKKLVIGENVTSKGPDGYYFNILGGARWATCASTDITVQSGTWRNIYVGTYGYSSAASNVTGNAKLTMTGGTLTGFITPFYGPSGTTPTLGGNMDIYLSNMSAATIYCAPLYRGTVSGDVNITLGEGAVITGAILTGGLGSSNITGNVNITLDGADTTGCDKIHKGGGTDYTGTIGGCNITLKSGVFATSVTGFGNVAVDIPQGKTLTLNDCSLKANTVQSAGTLAFAGRAQLTASAATGTVSCVITDQVITNNPYVTAPAGSGFVFDGNALTENNGVWVKEDMENFQGLVLSYDAGVTLTLYSGFDTTTVVQPYRTENNTKYYPNVSGQYRLKATRSGYITQYENIYVSDEEALTRMAKHYSLTKRDKAWDPEYANKLTDEALATMSADISQWPRFAAAFTSPVFAEGRPLHKFTTQKEMEDFIAGLDTDNDHMYVYSMGTTPGASAFNMPLVIFTETDLSGAATLEEAAALLRANGKPTVHYEGQIHGNEYASGEAALGTIALLDTKYGDDLLDAINVYVIPRLNPEGAHQNKRVMPVANLDPNRDFLNITSYEIQQQHYVYNLFMPELVIDGHEYNVRLERTTTPYKDIMINASRAPFATKEMIGQSEAIASALFENMAANGLGYGYYNDTITGANSNIGTGYSSYRGSLFILLESYGIHGGTHNMARRVAAHVTAVDAMLQYVHQNAQTVKQVINDQRQQLVTNGKTYGTGEKIPLKTVVREAPEENINGKTLNLVTGELTDVTFYAKTYDVVTRDREAPTAYLIPADHQKIDYILWHTQLHGISHYKIPEGSVVMVQHVGGSTTEAVLTDEQQTVFPKGAYVFGMDQDSAMILAMLMEPDVNDVAEYNATYAQAGVFALTDGEYPVYRYVQNLNAEGRIDYAVIPSAPQGITGTVPTKDMGGTISGLDADKLYEYRMEGDAAYTPLPAGTTTITGLAEGKYYIRLQAVGSTAAGADAVITLYTSVTVYLDQKNGSADNDGYSEDAAVTTYATAYAQLAARINNNAEPVTGVIVLTSEYTFTYKTINFPEHTFPVVLTSKTGAEGFNYTHTVSSGNTNGEIKLNGPTTFRNITLANNAKDSYVYLSAGGHKLVIESDVTTTGAKRFMLVGGRKDDDSTNADMTVAAGLFDVIYLATHKGTHNGPIKFTMTGGTANSYITPSYSGTVTGDITIYAENANLGGIFLGNTSRNDVTGNVTVTLGQGVTWKTFYAGSRDAGNITGTVTVIADGVDLSANTIIGKAKNTTGTIGGLKLVLKQGQLADVADSFVTRDGVDIVLGCDQTTAATLNYACNLDLNGCDADITVTGGKTLTVWDSATDDFTVQDAQGYGTLSVTGNAVAKEGYVVRSETGGNSYHRWDLALSNITLRPSNAGIYYTGQFGVNELYRENVESCGIVLSLNPDPSLDKADSLYTVLTQWPEEGKGYGALLADIMKTGNSDRVNEYNACQIVYGAAYIKYNDGTVVYSSTARFTLKHMVEYADSMWQTLTQTQKGGLLGMYGRFTSVMDTWEIPNLKATAQ